MNETNEKNEITVKYTVDGNEIKLTPSIVQKYIVGSDTQITLQEFKFFTELCKARGLNPFLKECYCIKYGDQPAQIVVGKDAILKRAILDPRYDGMESGVIVLDNENGEITERKGTFFLTGKETLVGGWANVYRKDWTHPIYVSVSFDEVAQKKNGQLNHSWKSKSATMVEKVAKVRALREAFVEQLSGMYEAEEMEIDMSHQNQTISENSDRNTVIQQDEPSEENISINDL